MTGKPGKAIRMNDSEMRQTIQATHDAVVEIKAACRACSRQVAAHDVILEGPAANGNSPGLKTRMDRQEQFKTRMSWAIGVLGVGVFGLLIDVIRNCFIHH